MYFWIFFMKSFIILSILGWALYLVIYLQPTTVYQFIIPCFDETSIIIVSDTSRRELHLVSNVTSLHWRHGSGSLLTVVIENTDEKH